MLEIRGIMANYKITDNNTVNIDGSCTIVINNSVANINYNFKSGDYKIIVFSDANGDVTLNEVRDVCKKAYIDDYIMSLPNKYNTIIGEGGVNLSGGQKVRVMLALILISRPEFLLLDEPFGDLDPITLRTVTNSLKNIAHDFNMTIIMISHNTDFIKELSNRAIMMDDGLIVDDGENVDEIVNNFIGYCKADYLMEE